MADNQNDSVTVSKDMLYGGAVVVLACLLMISVFTQGFGLVKGQAPSCPSCPACNCGSNSGTTNPSQNPTNNGTTVQPSAPAVQQLSITDGGLPALGQASAPVTIVEFSDFECPYCYRLFGDAEAGVRTNYVNSGKVKLYFRDFPLSFHQFAMPAAIAANCADAQGKFWQMHDLLFTNQNNWTTATDVGPIFKGYAASLGLDNATFATCYDNQTPAASINADEAQGQAYGVQGTPASFIIIPMSKISSADMNATMASLNQQYGANALSLFEDNSNDYVVLVPERSRTLLSTRC